jgi:hypothetical protein
VAINFVHDRRSWEEMNAIETALHHPILRVETRDFDEMEKVRVILSSRKTTDANPRPEDPTKGDEVLGTDMFA